jgi:CheY-like chemotaxis protein
LLIGPLRFTPVKEERRRGYTFPAIALSGYGQEEDIARAHEAGFAIHLTKPTPPSRLAHAIASVTA